MISPTSQAEKGSGYSAISRRAVEGSAASRTISDWKRTYRLRLAA